jgi:hypothetical protein
MVLESLIGIISITVVLFMVKWFSIEGIHICATSKILGKNDKMAMVNRQWNEKLEKVVDFVASDWEDDHKQSFHKHFERKIFPDMPFEWHF